MVGVVGGCSTVGVGVGVGIVGVGRAGEELRQAVAQGDKPTVLALINKGVGVNLTDEVSLSYLL